MRNTTHKVCLYGMWEPTAITIHAWNPEAYHFVANTHLEMFIKMRHIRLIRDKIAHAFSYRGKGRKKWCCTLSHRYMETEITFRAEYEDEPRLYMLYRQSRAGAKQVWDASEQQALLNMFNYILEATKEK